MVGQKFALCQMQLRENKYVDKNVLTNPKSLKYETCRMVLFMVMWSVLMTFFRQ